MSRTLRFTTILDLVAHLVDTLGFEDRERGAVRAAVVAHGDLFGAFDDITELELERLSRAVWADLTDGDAWPFGPGLLVRCACGDITGERCEWVGPREDTVVVEYLPEHLRGSALNAGSRGWYPSNGAERVRVERSCAFTLVQQDGEWVEVVNASQGREEQP